MCEQRGERCEQRGQRRGRSSTHTCVNKGTGGVHNLLLPPTHLLRNDVIVLQCFTKPPFARVPQTFARLPLPRLQVSLQLQVKFEASQDWLARGRLGGLYVVEEIEGAEGI